MYTPPPLGSENLDDLIALCGGDKLACRLLDITPRTLRRWRSRVQDVPQVVLKLLWFASPWGTQAANVDLFNEVRLLRALANALDRQGKIPVEAERFIESLRSLGQDEAAVRPELPSSAAATREPQ